MNFLRIGRNAVCPCGSGKKFKKCHLNYKDVKAQRLNIDPFDAAKLIIALPDCRHSRAAEMIASLKLSTPTGKQILIKLKSLSAYLQLGFFRQEHSTINKLEGVLINPRRTSFLDPDGPIYLALSSSANDSTIIHQLAHIVDLVRGSSLDPDKIAKVVHTFGLPYEIVEHSQEFGDILIELAEKFDIELDAEDEIIAILARQRLLLPFKIIQEGQRENLLDRIQIAFRYLRDNQNEIDNSIKHRFGYLSV